MHDFIEITIHLITQEIRDLKAFYEQLHSINEIANRLGLSYSTVRDQIARQGLTLRTKKSVSFSNVFKRAEDVALEVGVPHSLVQKIEVVWAYTFPKCLLKHILFYHS